MQEEEAEKGTILFTEVMQWRIDSDEFYDLVLLNKEVLLVMYFSDDLVEHDQSWFPLIAE
jgi:hypothetical protein